MYHRYYKTKTLSFLIVILFFVFVYAPVSTQAQSLFKLNSAGPPGGGQKTTTTTIKNDQDKTSTIWTIMGITTGLVLFYKFFIQKKEPKKDVTDSTSTSNNLLKVVDWDAPIVEKVKKDDDSLPFKIYMGIRSDDPVYNKKTYVLGVSFNL